MEFDAQNALENAKKSLNDKKLDMVCLNILEEENYFEVLRMKFILLQ